MTITVAQNRTSTYVFTTTDRNCDMVKYLRNGIKISNAQSTTKQYVKLQARGHRQGKPEWNQSLPLDFGTSFDVYVYTRYEWYKSLVTSDFFVYKGIQIV